MLEVNVQGQGLLASCLCKSYPVSQSFANSVCCRGSSHPLVFALRFLCLVLVVFLSHPAQGLGKSLPPCLHQEEMWVQLLFLSLKPKTCCQEPGPAQLSPPAVSRLGRGLLGLSPSPANRVKEGAALPRSSSHPPGRAPLHAPSSSRLPGSCSPGSARVGSRQRWEACAGQPPRPSPGAMVRGPACPLSHLQDPCLVPHGESSPLGGQMPPCPDSWPPTLPAGVGPLLGCWREPPFSLRGTEEERRQGEGVPSPLGLT